MDKICIGCGIKLQDENILNAENVDIKFDDLDDIDEE